MANFPFIPFIIQAIVTISLFLIVLHNLHINGPVGNSIILLPIFLCFIVGVVSLIVYSVYASAFSLGKGILAFAMPFAEIIAFFFLWNVGEEVVYSIYKNTEFPYNVNLSAPELSPVQVTSFRLKNGSDVNEPFGSCRDIILDRGITWPIYEERYINEDHSVPKRLIATWISFQDRKVYSIDAELPYDTIRTFLKKEDEGNHKGGIGYCFLPGGEVRLFLGHDIVQGRILLDWSGKGIECKDEKTLEELCKALECKDLEQYFDKAYSGNITNDHRWITSLQKKGDPTPMVKKCFERYNYDLVFEFKGEDYTVTKYDIIYTNAERSYKYDNEDSSLTELSDNIACPSILSDIASLTWKTSKYEYRLEMHLDKNYIFRTFEENYGNDRMQKGEYKVSIWIENENYMHLRYNLMVGGKEDVYDIDDDKTEYSLVRENLEDQKDKTYWNSKD